MSRGTPNHGTNLGRNAPDHPRMIAAAEKQRQALELRKAGMTFDQIAARLGYANHSGAAKAVRKAVQAITREAADELRTLEAERLDRMMLALWQAALGGTRDANGNVIPPDLDAMDRVLRIMARRAKLFGLDKTPPREQGIQFIVQMYAIKAAEAAGLEPSVVVAEAQRILAEASQS